MYINLDKLNKNLLEASILNENSNAVYDDAETIIRVQQALNNAGFDSGEPDGIAGPLTHAAMNSFQEANGLPISDKIDDNLLTALGLK